jgi:two-component system, response regulator / RNA-binding antiterminator
MSTRRLVLGQYGALTPEKACDLAREKLAGVARGEDPSAERLAVRAGVSVTEVCDWYLKAAEAGRILGRSRRPINASTLKMDRSRVETHIKPLLGARLVSGLTLRDIEGMQADIAVGESARGRIAGRGGRSTGGSGVASRTVGTLRSLLGHAARLNIVGKNPAEGVRRLALECRQRRLSDDELRHLGQVMRSLAANRAQTTRLGRERTGGFGQSKCRGGRSHPHSVATVASAVKSARGRVSGPRRAIEFYRRLEGWNVAALSRGVSVRRNYGRVPRFGCPGPCGVARWHGACSLGPTPITAAGKAQWRSERPMRIVIVDENAARSAIIESGLREAGYDDIVRLSEKAALLKRLEALEPDVVLIDLANPNRDSLEAMLKVSRTVRRPVAMFVDQSDAAMIEAAVDAGVSAYIVDGLRKERVKAILDMAVSRFNAYERLRRELEEAKDQLAERKVIERAKGILMKARSITEEEAYALLRRTAMNENRRLAEVAHSVVMAAGLLR